MQRAARTHGAYIAVLDIMAFFRVAAAAVMHIRTRTNDQNVRIERSRFSQNRS